MANVPVAMTLFCSDGTEIPLYIASVAEGTESNLTTSTQSNFTVSASAVGTAFAGKSIVASTPALATNGFAYAYLLRAGQIINVFPVGVAGAVSESRMELCSATTLIAGDQVRVMTNTAADRECALSVYTNKGRYHIFAITPSTGATNQLVSILTGNGIGTTLQGENLIKCLCTSVDGIKLAPSGMGVYVVDDKNSIVGAMVATAPASAQSFYDTVNIPINLNYQAQAITSA